jgi:hypothetical protein
MSHRQIHQTLKKHSPHGVHKAKKLFGLKFPKLFLLVGFIVLAYFLFKNPAINSQILKLSGLDYFGIFIAGLFLSFGFSAPFSVGFLILARPENIFIATLVCAVGSVISDFAIFKVIKFSFMNEFKELGKTPAIKKINSIARKNMSVKIRHYLMYIFAGILIATPLPDEAGVSLLAGLTTIKLKWLMLISFVLHALAIFVILFASV